MHRLILFAALAVSQWAPWILTGLVGGPVPAVTGVAAFAAVLWWAIRRTPPQIRPTWGLSSARPAGPLLLTGLAVGALVYLAVFSIRWWGGGGLVVEVHGDEVWLVLATGLLVAGYQAFSEEVVFRGAVFTLLVPDAPVRSAIAVSTALFVLFHAPRWRELMAGPYALHLLLAGLAFAVAYVRTGSLWFGMGLHAGWNAGAYLLREGDPALLRLAGSLPEGWDGWSSWVGVAGNALLLLVVLALPGGRVGPGRAGLGPALAPRRRAPVTGEP
ncbi:CPBP family intramembrane glutamic endopeptidase [Georgenia ruanii]|uniref:CPBP family intramembrane metalloprotease n=1 Tax=Georgenia ruanii TaxID=348442 RepID=A0A7J9UUP6_9MICO|nr:type II CAAX endopeptidase family protein [Georgenia ruanii]MPV88336.1 CPBP family intramembrane metalloprotease [Georgenia ruanii]